MWPKCGHRFSESEVIWSVIGLYRQLVGKKKPPESLSGGLFVPNLVVPKVRVELTRGCPYRFLS